MNEIYKNYNFKKNSQNLHQNESKFQVNLNSIAKEINSYNNNRSMNKILKETDKNLKMTNSSDKKNILNKKYMKLFEKDLENLHFFMALNSNEKEDDQEFITIDLQKKTLKKLLRNYNEERETNLLCEVDADGDGIKCNKKLDFKTKFSGNSGNNNEENLFLCAIDLIEGNKNKNNINNNKHSQVQLTENDTEINENNKNSNSSFKNNNKENTKFKNKVNKFKNYSGRKSTKSTSINIEYTKTSTKHNTINTNRKMSNNISNPNNLTEENENFEDDSGSETLNLSDLKQYSLNSNEFDFTNDQLVRLFTRFKSDFGGKNESLKFEIEQILNELNINYTSNDVIYKRYSKYVSFNNIKN